MWRRCKTIVPAIQTLAVQVTSRSSFASIRKTSLQRQTTTHSDIQYILVTLRLANRNPTPIKHTFNPHQPASASINSANPSLCMTMSIMLNKFSFTISPKKNDYKSDQMVTLTFTSAHTKPKNIKESNQQSSTIMVI